MVFDFGEYMAMERWSDDRLDRLADQTEANTRNIEANTQNIEANTRNIEGNTRNIEANTQSISQLISVIEEQQKANTTLFEMLIQEIRGLRSENRKILSHLFGEDSE